MKKACVALFVFVMIVLFVLGCGMDAEEEAIYQAIGFAENFAGFNIHNQDHDLNVRETGLSVDETFYVVEGTVKRESDMTHMTMMANMEYLNGDGWSLRELRLDGEMLYEE